MKKRYATFERFELAISEEDAKSGSHPGQCDEDIKNLRTLGYIKRQLDKLERKALRDELAEYGAWKPDELDNHEDNLDRILWIACGNILEDIS